MAYIFREEELPKLISVNPGRERTFLVNQELANTGDLLAGVTRDQPGAGSPDISLNGEHFYLILEGHGVMETEQGSHPVGPGTMISIPAAEVGSSPAHRLRATDSALRYFELQTPAPIVESKAVDGMAGWKRIDGTVWLRTN